MTILMVVSQGEIDDFYSEIKNAGLPVEDFSYQEKDLTEWKPGKPVPLKGEITISRKSTSKEKTYASGSGTNWLGDFTLDLHNGFYN